MPISKYFEDSIAKLIAKELGIDAKDLDSKIDSDDQWKKSVIEVLPKFDSNNQLLNGFFEKYNKVQYEKSEQGKREAEERRQAEEAEAKKQRENREKLLDIAWRENPDNKKLTSEGKAVPPRPKTLKKPDYGKIDPAIVGKENQARDLIQQYAFTHLNREPDLYQGVTLHTNTPDLERHAALYRQKENPFEEKTAKKNEEIEKLYEDLGKQADISAEVSPAKIRGNLSKQHIRDTRNAYHSSYKEELNKLEKRHRKYVETLAPILSKRFTNSPGVRFHSGDENYEKHLIKKANKSLLNQRALLLEKNFRETAPLARGHMQDEMQAERDIANTKNISTKDKSERLQALKGYRKEKGDTLNTYINRTKQHERDVLNSRNAEKQEELRRYEEERSYPKREMAHFSAIAHGHPMTIPQRQMMNPPELVAAQHGFSEKGSTMGDIGASLTALAPHLKELFASESPPVTRKREGGRIHRAEGGMLKAAVDNAVVNRIPTIESLENLERKLAIDSLDKQIKARKALKEGGSPIQEGAVQAKHVALLDSMQKRVDQLKTGGNKQPPLESMLEAVMRALAARKNSRFKPSADAYLAGHDVLKEKRKQQENREDKAADSEHEIAKLSLEEEKNRRHLDNEERHIEAQKARYNSQEAHERRMEGLASQKASGEKPLTPSQTTALGKADEAIGSSQHMQHLIERQKGLSKKIGNHPLLGRLVSGTSDVPYVGGLLSLIPETILSHVSDADRADIIEWDKNNAAIVAASQGIAKNMPRSSASLKLIEAGKMRLGEDKANKNIAEGLMNSARVAENAANNTYERITGESPVPYQEPPKTEYPDREKDERELKQLYKEREFHKKLGGIIKRHASLR